MYCRHGAAVCDRAWPGGSPTIRDQRFDPVELAESPGVLSVLRELGYVVARCDADGVVIEADPGWSTLLRSVPPGDVAAIHPRLVHSDDPPAYQGSASRPRAGVPSDGDADHVDGTRAARGRGGVVSTLLPFNTDGDVVVVEFASFPPDRADGSFVVAAREAPGREADDLTRRYLSAFLDTSDVIVVGGRLDGRIRFWNPAATNAYGYTKDEIIGQDVHILVPRSRHDELDAIMSAVASGEKVEDLESVRLTKSGKTFEVRLTAVPIREPGGGVVGIATMVRDISALKAANRLSRLYATTTDMSPVGLMLWKPDRSSNQLRLLALNRAARALTGLDSAAVGRDVVELRAETRLLDDLDWPPATPLSRERRFLGAIEVADAGGDGSSREVRTVERHVFSVDDALVALTITDATERRRAESERARLLERVAEAEEAERRALAEALHDDPIQLLAAANMEIGALRRSAGDGDVELARRAAGAEDKVRRAIKALRTLVFELYPPDLDVGGLGVALRTLLDHVFDDGTDVRLSESRMHRVRSDTRLAVYRIVQQALLNVRRHAGATHVEVVLAIVDDDLVVTVRDDGRGFDVGGTMSRPGHLGLRTMRERALSHGGSLQITSADSGTTVEIRLPATHEE